jgi:membrane protease YdiL (CAAX protease family)
MDRILSFIFGTEEELAQLTDILIIDYSFIGLLLSVTIVVLAPLGEEILFRGFLQKKLEESWQDITRAVLVTSLFFAFIHMNPVWIIQIYLLGVILGYLAWKTGSILTSLVLHSLNNGAALILTNYSESINAYYLWNNHVSPLFLVIAICSLSFGFYNLNKLVRE